MIVGTTTLPRCGRCTDLLSSDDLNWRWGDPERCAPCRLSEIGVVKALYEPWTDEQQDREAQALRKLYAPVLVPLEHPSECICERCSEADKRLLRRAGILRQTPLLGAEDGREEPPASLPIPDRVG